MTELKCPICETILDKAFINDKIRGCPKCRNIGNVELWQALIDTKKKLDIAVDALNAVTATPLNSRVIHDVANTALEQITALEQKDVK